MTLDWLRHLTEYLVIGPHTPSPITAIRTVPYMQLSQHLAYIAQQQPSSRTLNSKTNLPVDGLERNRLRPYTDRHMCEAIATSISCPNGGDTRPDETGQMRRCAS
jgi:hypothetical protein